MTPDEIVFSLFNENSRPMNEKSKEIALVTLNNIKNKNGILADIDTTLITIEMAREIGSVFLSMSHKMDYIIELVKEDNRQILNGVSSFANKENKDKDKNEKHRYINNLIYYQVKLMSSFFEYSYIENFSTL